MVWWLMKSTLASRHSQYTDIFGKSKENTHFIVFFGISSDSLSLSVLLIMVILHLMLFYTRESVEKVRFSSRLSIRSDNYMQMIRVLSVILYGDQENFSVRLLQGHRLYTLYVYQLHRLWLSHRTISHEYPIISSIIYDPSMLLQRITHISLSVVRIFRTTHVFYRFFQESPRVLYMSLRIKSLESIN